jgi:phosphotransferase system enzyme I (PtsI)
MGIDELSVAPPMLPQIKHLIRHLKISEAKELAEAALCTEDSVDVLVRARALVQRVVPGLFESQPSGL